MLTLSGALDHVVSWSNFSLQHKKSENYARFVVKFFQAFTGCHFNYMLVLCGCCLLWLLSYKQQSLAYSNMFYLLWSHVEYSIVFFITPITCLSKKTGTYSDDLSNFLMNTNTK